LPAENPTASTPNNVHTTRRASPAREARWARRARLRALRRTS
jgi:hypothetical protein